MSDDQTAPRAEAKANATAVPNRDCGYDRLRGIDVVCKRPARSSRIVSLNRIQRMGAQAVIGAFRTVSCAVLQDEAGLEAVETRLARKIAQHVLDVRSLLRTHPLWSVVNGIMGRFDGYKCPFFETWSRHKNVIPRTKAHGPTAKLPYGLPPRHNLRGILVVTREVEARRFHQRILTSALNHPLLYTNASVRHGLAGASVVQYDPKQYRPAYRAVYQDPIGGKRHVRPRQRRSWRSTRRWRYAAKASGQDWIMTDSQGAL